MHQQMSKRKVDDAVWKRKSAESPPAAAAAAVDVKTDGAAEKFKEKHRAGKKRRRRSKSSGAVRVDAAKHARVEKSDESASDRALSTVTKWLCDELNCDHKNCSVNRIIGRIAIADFKTEDIQSVLRDCKLSEVQLHSEVRTVRLSLSLNTMPREAAVAIVELMWKVHCVVHGGTCVGELWCRTMESISYYAQHELSRSIQFDAALNVVGVPVLHDSDRLSEAVRKHVLHVVSHVVQPGEHCRPRRTHDNLRRLYRLFDTIGNRAPWLLGHALSVSLEQAISYGPNSSHGSIKSRFSLRSELIRDLCSEQYTGCDGALCDVFTQIPVDVEAYAALEHVVSARIRITEYRAQSAVLADQLLLAARSAFCTPLRNLVKAYLIFWEPKKNVK